MTTHTLPPTDHQATQAKPAMQPLKPIPEAPAIPAMATPVRLCNAATKERYTGAELGYRGKA